MNEGNVNSQIVDSVADVVLLSNGQAPSQAFGMLDAVMTDTLGMAMYNAVARQQGASMVGSAAVTAACARMVSVPFPGAPIIVPAPPPLPVVEPLDPPPNPMPAAAVIAAATAQAEAAIAALKAEAGQSSAAAAEAQANLAQIATDATPPPPKEKN